MLRGVVGLASALIVLALLELSCIASERPARLAAPVAPAPAVVTDGGRPALPELVERDPAAGPLPTL